MLDAGLTLCKLSLHFNPSVIVLRHSLQLLDAVHNTAHPVATAMRDCLWHRLPLVSLACKVDKCFAACVMCIVQAKGVAGLMCVSESLAPRLLQLPHWEPDTAGQLQMPPANACNNGGGEQSQAWVSAAPLVPRLHQYGVLEVRCPLPHSAATFSGDVDDAVTDQAAVAAQPPQPPPPPSSPLELPHSTPCCVDKEREAGLASASAQTCRVELYPFVLMSDVTAGSDWAPLSEVWPGCDPKARQAIAAQLGRMLAALHVRGYFAAAAAGTDSPRSGEGGYAAAAPTSDTEHGDTGGKCPVDALGDQAGRVCDRGGLDWWAAAGRGHQAWWHDRCGSAWLSGSGQVVREGEVMVGPHPHLAAADVAVTATATRGVQPSIVSDHLQARVASPAGGAALDRDQSVTAPSGGLAISHLQSGCAAAPSGGGALGQLPSQLAAALLSSPATCSDMCSGKKTQVSSTPLTHSDSCNQANACSSSSSSSSSWIPLSSRWQPFLSFLQLRREEIESELAACGNLPTAVLQQVCLACVLELCTSADKQPACACRLTVLVLR
jgi:hypothetical protein